MVRDEALMYYLPDAKIRLTSKDGTVEDRTVTAAENIGPTDLNEFQIELKGPRDR